MGEHYGIIVSGGPAPGINSVISSCVIEACNAGKRIFGLDRGFYGVCSVGSEAVRELKIEHISNIYHTGGSVLGLSRYNPLLDEHRKNCFIETLKVNGIGKLIIIGGEGSAYLSHRIASEFPQLGVVHLPKTIDNDLILPNSYPSFGFETARSVSTEILLTLMEDARTCRRWFIVTTMGRRAGFLALQSGLASGTTLTMIPEEFSDRRYSLDEVAQVVVGSMLRRFKGERPYGVVLVAEGLIDRIAADSCDALRKLPLDDLGRIKYSRVEFSEILGERIEALCSNQGVDVRIVCKNIGYELRCHAPVSFDIEYTRFLGYGAIKMLQSGKSGILLARGNDRIEALALKELVQPDGTIKSRQVDLNSDLYAVARSFMVR